MKVRKSASVNAVPEIANLISGLQSDNYFKLKIENALDKLKETLLLESRLKKTGSQVFTLTDTMLPTYSCCDLIIAGG